MDIIALFRYGCPDITRLIIPGRRYYNLPRVRGWLVIFAWPDPDTIRWN